MVKVGFIVDGETELTLFNSKKIKEQLGRDFNIQVVGVRKYSGGDIERQTNCLITKGAEKVIVLKDLEQLSDKEALLRQIQQKDTLTNDNILVVVKRMIEAWFLADTNALQNINANINRIHNPENIQNPYHKLKMILGQVNKHYKRKTKVQLADLFIDKEFSFGNAAKHPQCHSVREFVDILRELGNDE